MLFGLFGLAFPNCGGGGPIDTATPTDTVWPTAIEIACDDSQSPDRWTYVIGADGDPLEAQLTTVLLGETIDLQLKEEHFMSAPSFSPERNTDIMVAELDVVYDEDDLILGETTLFRCTDFGSGDMAWRIDIWDSAGNLGYCAVFSTDARNLNTFENASACETLQLTES